jgi:hypothetical protein
MKGDRKQFEKKEFHQMIGTRKEKKRFIRDYVERE